MKKGGNEAASMKRNKKKKKPTKYEWLSKLLGDYGSDRITQEQFWGQMKMAGYGQEDIALWCDEYYRRETENAQ
jgi:hypothetical protein